jgi:hypothetical protein
MPLTRCSCPLVRQPILPFSSGVCAAYVNVGFGTKNYWGYYTGTCQDPDGRPQIWTIQKIRPAASGHGWTSPADGEPGGESSTCSRSDRLSAVFCFHPDAFPRSPKRAPTGGSRRRAVRKRSWAKDESAVGGSAALQRAVQMVILELPGCASALSRSGAPESPRLRPGHT